MKVLIQIKLQFLIIGILLTSAFNICAQESKQISRYNNDLYKIAFETPNDSTKQAGSTEKRVIFIGQKDKFGATARLEFIINEQSAADRLSQLLSSDAGMETMAAGLISQLKVKNAGFEFTVLEKKRVKIAGLNGFKLVNSAVLSNGKVRSALFAVPVPEHKRMYSFLITASEENFDKWFSNAEASVNSFELLKTKSK